MPELRFSTLDGSRVTVAGLGFLRILRELHFGVHAGVTDAGLVVLGGLTDLRDLIICDCDAVGGAELASVRALSAPASAASASLGVSKWTILHFLI